LPTLPITFSWLTYYVFNYYCYYITILCWRWLLPVFIILPCWQPAIGFIVMIRWLLLWMWWYIYLLSILEDIVDSLIQLLLSTWYSVDESIVMIHSIHTIVDVRYSLLIHWYRYDVMKCWWWCLVFWLHDCSCWWYYVVIDDDDTVDIVVFCMIPFLLLLSCWRLLCSVLMILIPVIPTCSMIHSWCWWCWWWWFAMVMMIRWRYRYGTSTGILTWYDVMVLFWYIVEYSMVFWWYRYSYWLLLMISVVWWLPYLLFCVADAFFILCCYLFCAIRCDLTCYDTVIVVVEVVLVLFDDIVEWCVDSCCWLYGDHSTLPDVPVPHLILFIYCWWWWCCIGSDHSRCDTLLMQYPLLIHLFACVIPDVRADCCCYVMLRSVDLLFWCLFHCCLMIPDSTLFWWPFIVVDDISIRLLLMIFCCWWLIPIPVVEGICYSDDCYIDIVVDVLMMLFDYWWHSLLPLWFSDAMILFLGIDGDIPYVIDRLMMSAVIFILTAVLLMNWLLMKKYYIILTWYYTVLVILIHWRCILLMIVIRWLYIVVILYSFDDDCYEGVTVDDIVMTCWCSIMCDECNSGNWSGIAVIVLLLLLTVILLWYHLIHSFSMILWWLFGVGEVLLLFYSDTLFYDGNFIVEESIHWCYSVFCYCWWWSDIVDVIIHCWLLFCNCWWYWWLMMMKADDYILMIGIRMTLLTRWYRWYGIIMFLLLFVDDDDAIIIDAVFWCCCWLFIDDPIIVITFSIIVDDTVIPIPCIRWWWRMISRWFADYPVSAVPFGMMAIVIDTITVLLQWPFCYWYCIPAVIFITVFYHCYSAHWSCWYSVIRICYCWWPFCWRLRPLLIR